MQRLEGLMRKAIQEYGMIQPGDRVAIGVSGGKDSIALTVGLAHLRRYMGIPFELVAISLDPQFEGKQTNFELLKELFAQLDVEYHIERTQIGEIVFDIRKEPNPCSLCAKLRRGTLHTLCKKLGCNKIALGHHLDDAIETFYMNLWGEGRIGCFSPVTHLSRKDLTMIRPLIFATEQQVRSAVAAAGFPMVKNPCPADGATRRQQMKEYVTEASKKDKAFRQKMLGAMQAADLDGWMPVSMKG